LQLRREALPWVLREAVVPLRQYHINLLDLATRAQRRNGVVQQWSPCDFMVLLGQLAAHAGPAACGGDQREVAHFR
jgi:hypothetical protein